jgi:uncharacterized protein (DUF1501 family)
MNFIHSQQFHSRRAFLRRSTQLAFTGVALPTAINLAALGEAAAFNATDYKALVCVFLYGGNDYANTLIPYDAASYAAYQTIRGTTGSTSTNGIALGRDVLAPMVLSATPTSVMGTSGLQYAFHPKMTGLRDLFNGGQAAVVLNGGPLVKPMTLEQYKSPNRTLYPIPPKLFSHNDQQSIWQSSSPEGSTVGWGGNIGDVAIDAGANTNSLFTCISVTGNAVFLSGDTALSYQVGRDGAVKIYSAGANAYPFGFLEVGKTMANLLAPGSVRPHNLENAYAAITKRAVVAETSISAAIQSTAPTNGQFAAPYNKFANNNSLSAQLRMVARLIAARNTLGSKRQVFMVSLGGFDLHDNLMGGHDTNMERVSQAMTAFYEAMKELGVGEQVTAFTATEFGRTLTSNGDGSDHGWGGHQIVVGDAIKGKAFYGYAPPVSITSDAKPENQWHTGAGRLLPTTSVDQYAATLARWFGVEDAELNGILPNLPNFGVTGFQTATGNLNYPKDLGFMKTYVQQPLRRRR